MPSQTVENYLKATLSVALETGSEWVSTGRLATAMTVSPGTVTSMIKSLAESGLVEYRRHKGVSLTEQGRQVALRMQRRHRLIELFLVKTLGLTWDQVHDEAETMEHAVSDFLVDRIDSFLGRPESDPHGDPIPAADGTLRGDALIQKSLSEVSQGESVRVIRVTNQDSGFLRFLADSGLQIDQTLVMKVNNPDAGCLTVKVGTKSVAIGYAAANHILVTPT